MALPCTLAFHILMGVTFGLVYGYEQCCTRGATRRIGRESSQRSLDQELQAQQVGPTVVALVDPSNLQERRNAGWYLRNEDLAPYCA